MSKELEKNLMEVLNKIEPRYKKFRHHVGEVALEAGINPFVLMIAFLEASLEQEKHFFADSKKKAEEGVKIPKSAAAKIAEALGVKLEDVQMIKIGPEEAMKIVSALADSEDDDDDDDELDF